MPDCFADRPRNNSEEMQRCPYLHEMKERLLSQPTPTDSLDMERLDGTPVKEPNLHNDYPAHTNPGVIPEPPEMPPDSLIGTVVKLNSDGYGSHTSPAHARQPLVPQNANNPPHCLTPTHSGPTTGTLPKNAKGGLGTREEKNSLMDSSQRTGYAHRGEQGATRHIDGQHKASAIFDGAKDNLRSRS
ncbi:hypothetical protein WN48_00564 [Eufriesea mexicana]|nr:hypothetical protein WN48_00564 [Eufriesea mexicana]